MTNETKGMQNALESAKSALGKVNKEKYPKLYESHEARVEALELALNQKTRAEKAEKIVKKHNLGKKQTSKNKQGDQNPSPKKKEGFDYAEKAFLQQNDVKREEFELAQKIIGKSGMTIDELVDSDYFRSEQKKAREHKASENAVPDGTKRGAKTTSGNVDYWIAKGELPPDTPENRQLRRDVVNTEIKQSKDSSKFTDNPVVGA